MKTRGYSLPEMLVAMGIMSGMASVVFATLRVGYDFLDAAEAHMAVSQELSRSIDAMSRELAASQTSTLSVPIQDAWSSSVTFQVPQDMNGDISVLDALGNTEWSNPVTYSLGGNGTQIQRAQATTRRVVANGVTALQFRRQTSNPTILEMTVTVQRGNKFHRQATLATRVRLRN